MMNFLSKVVNSKGLWRAFADWLILGRDLEEKIYRMFDPWNVGFKGVVMEIIGFEIAFDKD